MLRSTFVALTGVALAVSSLTAFAQQDAARPSTHARDFLARHPGDWRVVNDPASGNPSFVYGSRFAIGGPQGNAQSWEAAARAVIADQSTLFGVTNGELELKQVKQLDLSRIGSSDKVAVEFDQVVDGITAFGGAITILFDAKSGDVIALDTTAIAYANRVDLTPKSTLSQAIANARVGYRAEFGADFTDVISVDPVIVGPSPFFGRKSILSSRGPVLAWVIEAKTRGLRTKDNVPMQARVFVAADDGAVIKVEPSAHSIDGQVSGNCNIGPEINSATNQETPGLPNVYVRQTSSAGAILATTDANGNYAMAQAGPLTLYVDLSGPFCKVSNQAATNSSFTVANVVTGIAQNFLFNPTKAEFTTAEVAGFYHVAKFRDWVKSVDPADTTMDFQVLTRVNMNDLLCNAYYDGSALNLERAGSGCANTAMQDVIQHEEGHWANERYNGTALTGAFHEGNADDFAYYINDDPCLSDFTVGSTGCLRSALQTSVFKCADDGESCNGGEVHTEGEALASAVWAVRARLKTALGNGPGQVVANSLFLRWMQVFNDGAILNVIKDHWLALDDDNGNLADLTPHFSQVNGGFVDYGWPGIPDPVISITQSPADNAEIGDQQGVTIKANVTSVLSTVGVVQLLYSTNGTSFSTLAMAPTGVPSEYSATIPGLASPNSVFWYVHATNGLGDQANAPKTAPTNRRVYHVGKLVILQKFDFEAATDEGWTHANLSGSNGDQWQRNNPANSNAGSDPNTAFSGTKVWGTDLSVSGTDGMYEPSASGELRSPIFNLSTSSKVRLQYRRWLTVEEGQFDQATIRVNGTTVFSNPNTGNLIDTEWTLHDIDITAQAGNNASVQINYRLAADGGLEFGGWNVDDFTLYRVDANPVGFFTTYGSGCQGSGGLVPALAGSGTPTPGQNVTLTISNGKPNGAGVLILGTAQASVAASGCTLLVGGGLIPLSLTLGPTGSFPLTGGIPLGTPANDTYWQWFGGDSGAPNHVYSASNGLKMHIQ